jgi:hypothetical protein
MATKKPRSKAVSKVATKAVETGKQDSNHIEQKAKSDNRESVFVRISPRANEILKNAAKAPRTKATVIEALLENFDREKNLEIKNRILSGHFINPLEEHGELLELRSWAEHAFENNRYVWAGGMYKMLANHPSSSEGLKNICNYKLSVCLIRLSYAVRDEALKEASDKGVKVVYDDALTTLDEAIVYTEKVAAKLGNGLLFPKLVLYYNLASCHSLKAQYMVESELDPSSTLIAGLRNAKKDVDAKTAVWRTIGESWRSNQKEGNIDFEAEKAFHALQKIFPFSVQGKTQTDPSWVERDDLSLERIWLVDSTLEDEDFIFLRFDKQKWQPKFEGWTSLALQGRKPNAEAVRALIDKERR